MDDERSPSAELPLGLLLYYLQAIAVEFFEERKNCNQHIFIASQVLYITFVLASLFATPSIITFFGWFL